MTAAKLSWNADDDVTGYSIHRSTTPDFTPDSGNRIDQTTATSYTDSQRPAGTYYYRVVASNEFGAGQPSNEVRVEVLADTTAPTVSLTEPVAGATLSKTVTLSATASDAIALAGVRFEIDGAPLGALDTAAPFRATWDTTTATNGAHTVTAVARDATGNERPATVQVTVDNRVIGPGSPPIAAYAFDDGSGLIARDSSGNNRTGSLSGNPVWTTEGRHGGALIFDGYNDSVGLPHLGTFYEDGFTFEAWIKKRNDVGDMGIVGSWQSVYGEGGGVMLWVDHRNARPTLAQGLDSSLYLDSGIQPARDEWMHVAATSDGVTSDLYINGEHAASGPAPENFGSASNWTVGRYGSNYANPFAGVIDDVKIYNRPLTGPEIRGDMNGDIGPQDTVPPTAPGEFAAGGVTATTIAASWAASADAETGVARYILYRDGVEVGETTVTSYVFGNLSCATSYELAVEARDAAGNASPRATLQVETTPCRAVDGLVAAYAFDEGGGSTIFDSSGNGKTATLGGSWSPGRTGTALNGFADLPPLGTFCRQAFTLEAWVKPNVVAMSGDNAVVGTWVNTEGGGPMLWIDHVATHYQLTLSRGMDNYLDSGASPLNQQWQHLAATYDGQTARVYVDGILAASRTFTGDVGSSNSWRIGAYGSAGFFHGLIEDVRIYSRALSGDEVRTDMQTPVGQGAV